MCFQERGGTVTVKSPVKKIVTNDDGSVKHLEMRDGSIVSPPMLPRGELSDA